MTTCRSCAYARPHDQFEPPPETGDCDAPLPFWLVPHFVDLDFEHECRMHKFRDLAAERARSDHEDDGA